MLYLDYYNDKYFDVAFLNGSLFIWTFLKAWANKANDAFHNCHRKIYTVNVVYFSTKNAQLNTDWAQLEWHFIFCICLGLYMPKVTRNNLCKNIFAWTHFVSELLEIRNKRAVAVKLLNYYLQN